MTLPEFISYFLPCLCRFRDSEFKIQQHLHLDPIKRALSPNAQAQAQAQVLLPRPPNPQLKVIPAKASKCQSTSPILKPNKHPVASTTYTNRQCRARYFQQKQHQHVSDSWEDSKSDWEAGVFVFCVFCYHYTIARA